MKTDTSYLITLLASIHLLTGTTVLAAPVAVAIAGAAPLIEYHTLPTSATPTISTNHNHNNNRSFDAVRARIRSFVFNAAGRGAPAAFDDEDGDADEDDWVKWHSQWERQQQERRCNLWDVCVRVYKPGE